MAIPYTQGSNMALFQICDGALRLCKPTNFQVEKELQSLIEANLQTVFNCRLIASEFPTGTTHAGRIDTLAISEDGNPVILEYKKVESSELLNQGLYYLNWIIDHRGDFQVAANRALGRDIEVDWSDVRVICIAPGYKKYDLHAAQVMGASIELWQYRLYDDGSFYLDEVFRRATGAASTQPTNQIPGKNSVMAGPGKKASLTPTTTTYTIGHHLAKPAQSLRTAIDQLRDYILSIDDNIEESPKKFYIAYKTTQNFVCLDVRQSKVYLYLKLTPSDFETLPANARDVTQIGHYGTGDFELTILTLEDATAAEQWIRRAYDQVGGS